MLMKTPLVLLAVSAGICLCSCQSTVKQSPVYLPASNGTDKPKPKPQPQNDGALRQVPSQPEKPKDKPFPDIPLKEDTGTSPLIHDKADSPTYKRGS